MARLLGHSRVRAASFYIGSSRTPAANDQHVTPPVAKDEDEGDGECSPG